MMFKYLSYPKQYLNTLTHILLTILFLTVFSAAYSQQRTLTDEEFLNCKSRIERAHEGFYKLPYTQAYVRDVVMLSVRNGRAGVAPHFPVRQPAQNSDQLFKTWIENYPQEYDQYLDYLRSQHITWRTAASQNNH